MKKTERKHWVNGHQLRGGWHHTLCLSVHWYGVMFVWGSLPNGHRVDRLQAHIFKLI